MPAERITMRHAREIIRLKSSSVSAREISRRLCMARSTVRETMQRAEGAGLSWPLPEDMNDEALEAALYGARRSKRGHRRIEEPDCASVHRDLRRKRVTLVILWDEYIAANPGGYSYSRFCELYRAFARTLSVTMRQTHAAGERLRGVAKNARAALLGAQDGKRAEQSCQRASTPRPSGPCRVSGWRKPRPRPKPRSTPSSRPTRSNQKAAKFPLNSDRSRPRKRDDAPRNGMMSPAITR